MMTYKFTGRHVANFKECFSKRAELQKPQNNKEVLPPQKSFVEKIKSLVPLGTTPCSNTARVLNFSLPSYIL
jgi:hypothetical protein